MANGFDTTEESYAGDDPSGAGDTGVGYGSTSMDTGGNETDGSVLSQAGFNQARGITATNPYPDSFFSQLFGPENVNYAALGIDVQGIANLAYDRYVNPFGNIKGIKGVEGLSLREGLSPGEKTRFGEVISIDRPQNIGETIARTAFGFTPLGPIASFMGKDQLALAPDPQLNLNKGFNYDPTLDPNNPAYQGPQGFLGQLGKGIESITFGGARPITETSKGIMSLFEGQDAEKEMKDSVDQTGKNVLQDSSVSLMEPGINLASSFNTSRTRYGDLPTTTTVGDRNITNPSIALAVGIMRREPDVEFGQAMNRARMELSKRKFYADN